jgi:hypothetical protein
MCAAKLPTSTNFLKVPFGTNRTYFGTNSYLGHRGGPDFQNSPHEGARRYEKYEYESGTIRTGQSRGAHA